MTLLVFLNQGLAGFVLAAIAARFIFPAVSLEGKQMWLLRSSPLDLRALLWSKYWTGTLPLLVLAIGITAGTNLLLRASAFMMALSLGTVVLLTFAIASLALAFGALLSPVRHRELGPDSDRARRADVHDDGDRPAGRGDLDRGLAGADPGPGPDRRASRRFPTREWRCRWPAWLRSAWWR